MKNSPDPGPPQALIELVEKGLPFPDRETWPVYVSGPSVWREWWDDLTVWSVVLRVLWVAWGVTSIVLMYLFLPSLWFWLWFSMP